MEFWASAGTRWLPPAQGYKWRGSCSPRLTRPGMLWNNLGRIRPLFSLVQRPNQSILGTTSVNRESLTSQCQCSAALNHGCFFAYRHSVVSCFYDIRLPSPWQVLLGTIVKKIKMLQLSKLPRKLLGKTYRSFGFQWAIVQGLKIQNAEKKKLGFVSLKTSNFRVVLVIKSLATIHSLQQMYQVPQHLWNCSTMGSSELLPWSLGHNNYLKIRKKSYQKMGLFQWGNKFTKISIKWWMVRRHWMVRHTVIQTLDTEWTSKLCNGTCLLGLLFVLKRSPRGRYREVGP